MHFSRRRPVLVSLLLLTSAGCAGIVTLAYQVFVQTTTGQLVEQAELRGRVNRGSLREHARTVLDVVSVTSLAGALVLAVAVGLLRGRWRSALSAGLLVAGSTITSELLKKVLLERPQLVEGSPNSFPSGHTTVAAAVAAAAVVVSPRRLRPYVAVLGCGYAVVTGMATVIVGWHRPSDALAAYAVVLGWGTLAAALVLEAVPPLPADAVPDTGHRATALMLASVAVPFTAVAVAVITQTARHVPAPFGQLRQVAAYGGAMSAVAAAGLLTSATWLLVVPLVDAAGREEDTGTARGRAIEPGLAAGRRR